MICKNCNGIDTLPINHPERCLCIKCSHCDAVSYSEDSENVESLSNVLCPICSSTKYGDAKKYIEECQYNHLAQCADCREYIAEWNQWPDGLPVEPPWADKDPWHPDNRCFICRIILDNTEPSIWPDGAKWKDKH